MNGKTLLVEIGTEELPPKILRNLAKLFLDYVTIELKLFRLSYEKVFWFASPRRLAIKVINLQIQQLDRIIEKRGPILANAFDLNGDMTKETKNWITNNNIISSKIETLRNIKGEWLFVRKIVKGQKTELLIPIIIEKTLKKISAPKLMRWGDNNIKFIRPIHTITIIFGKKLISSIILGIKSKRVIYGHRFMGDSKITLVDADQYPEIILERGKVIADYEKRKEIIRTNAKLIASKLGGIVDLSNELLDEVNSLVEWPVVFAANFNKEFLGIPNELLVHIIKNKQKYFPIYDNKGILLPRFIFVSNIECDNSKQIIIGNEKVLHSRLVDAKFFFDIDKKNRLSDNLHLLDKIIFHNKLGSLQDKTKRIINLSRWIASKIGADINHSMRASLLSKCDLITNIVCEFAEMQGIIGMYYARYDGEIEDVSIALSQQYKPCFSGDMIPSTLIGCTLSISDKIDTMVGMFGINQFPKRSKDPLALRRAAFGVLRIIIEMNLPLNLKHMAQEAVNIYKGILINDNTVNDLIDFMFARLQKLYLENGFSLDVFQAVLSVRPLYPVDFDLRMKALSHFLSLDESTELIIVNKRVNNFLTKSNNTIINNEINLSLLKQKEEIELANYISKLTTKLKPYFTQGLYKEALIELTMLKTTIDNFFDKVTINTNDFAVYLNRLTLLMKIKILFLEVADISILKIRKKTDFIKKG
ncbi:glycine--tRNA ligase subunit beta [Candidatus Pantoea edessiphila]|uniref:Glycine--tRNA ligase beta subunit n=1 Tax=Candidatus Pantoea edessiphila TaxID=2044610 RepID=A0A2P5T195_9GAMM|nr:glycine--tRNA ligase subunit beta [Candidatus Pantoea edessiphila]PPI88355.1 glycine--tRNA ligase subunit beta [Candidatus Pantoea edessiphila]